jgi:hypothetical protein
MLVEAAKLHLVDAGLAVVDGRDAVFDSRREHEVCDGSSPAVFTIRQSPNGIAELPSPETQKPHKVALNQSSSSP